VACADSQFKDYPYPERTPENTKHDLLVNYVRGYVKRYGIDQLTEFNTRVENATKEGDKWKLTLYKHELLDGSVRETFYTRVS
jgi:cation diffusion facilitator CzcD-associated flavoprotein CzcO